MECQCPTDCGRLAIAGANVHQPGSCSWHEHWLGGACSRCGTACDSDCNSDSRKLGTRTTSTDEPPACTPGAGASAPDTRHCRQCRSYGERHHRQQPSSTLTTVIGVETLPEQFETALQLR